MDNPPFLEYSPTRLSEKNAISLLDKILKAHRYIFDKSKSKHQHDIIINEGKKDEKRFKYYELVKIIREQGYAEPLQVYYDRTDTVFGGTLQMSISNWQMALEFEYAGEKKIIQGPFRSSPSERELSNDIEFYREEICIESNVYDFEMCCRNYRGFLFSCIALVDAYINRHIILSNYNKLSSDNFVRLKESKNTDERIELFIKCYCNNNSFEDLKQRVEWDNFKKIKNLRNEIIHATNPYLGISIPDIATILNYSRKGIGELLLLFQLWQGRNTLAFIEKVRTSPIVHYNQITLMDHGNHTIKKQFKKG